jgi:hypothetical protein
MFDALHNEINVGDVCGCPSDSSTSRINFVKIVAFPKTKGSQQLTVEPLTLFLKGVEQRGNWHTDTENKPEWKYIPGKRKRKIMSAKLVKMITLKDKYIMLGLGRAK